VGTALWEGTCIFLLPLYYVICTILYRVVYWFIHLLLADSYEYLTPLQAAVGVVQKVKLFVMIVVLFVLVMLRDDILTQISCQQHSTMTMILVLDQGTRIT
jgi:hypothetical protein